MRAALAHTDTFLRATGPFDPAADTARPWWWLPAMVIGFAPIYGGLMGSLYLDSTERLLQIAFSAAKVPLLLFATSVLCLPGFFVLNTVLGLRDDLRDALQAILSGQAALSIALASLGPITRFWYVTHDGYRGALLFNAAIFGLATLAGHLVMRRYFRPLIARHPNHRITLIGWLVMYAFVGIQMGWSLRPFVGVPGHPVTFFRDQAFTNAYVVVFELIFG